MVDLYQPVLTPIFSRGEKVMELTGTSKEAQGRQAMLLRKLEAEKRKRGLVVPTKPSEVGKREGEGAL